MERIPEHPVRLGETCATLVLFNNTMTSFDQVLHEGLIIKLPPEENDVGSGMRNGNVIG